MIGKCLEKLLGTLKANNGICILYKILMKFITKPIPLWSFK